MMSVTEVMERAVSGHILSGQIPKDGVTGSLSKTSDFLGLGQKVEDG